MLLEKWLISPIVQFISILIYFILHFGNFNFIFLKIPLGIILILFIPSYNLINLLFPNFSIKLKLGLSSIFSLGFEILFMLIYYIFGILLFGPPFFFDIDFLVIIFAVISCLLILICFFKNSYKRLKSNGILYKKEKNLKMKKRF